VFMCMISWMIHPPCEITDQLLAVGTQNCFSTLFYTPYTNIKTSAQNAPKCTIARQKNQKIFWGVAQTPPSLGRGIPPPQTPPLSAPSAFGSAFPFLFIYDSNTAACCSVNTISQARYSLRIAISAYPTCIRDAPVMGVPVGILLCCLAWKKLEWRGYPMVKKKYDDTFIMACHILYGRP